MLYRIFFLSLMASTLFLLTSCGDDDAPIVDTGTGTGTNTGGDDEEFPAIAATFNGSIDLDNLHNYSSQDVPNYINRDNTEGNAITNLGATLGRVLFYDPKLSVDNSISCASCHQQEHAFSDLDAVSTGVDGTTGRHSMRLINARFADVEDFFWDRRANSLEEQTTMPIQDHIEMGFSGENGDPDFNDLIEKLSAEDYYQELFTAVYGDPTITENRMQLALAQFIRSIQSFDSPYDVGRAQVNNNNNNFPNFSPQENMGKNLFTRIAEFDNAGNRIGGGLGCQGCHRAPEFDIAPNSRNNGVVASASDPNVLDQGVTRSPSLRDLFNAQGQLNGPMMHTGTFSTIDQVIDHYNDIDGNIPNLDNRLSPGSGQKLHITDDERAALTAFLRTLSGTNVYTDERWSNPF